MISDIQLGYLKTGRSDCLINDHKPNHNSNI